MAKGSIARSCKSALCLRCAKVSVDNWVNQVSRMLHLHMLATRGGWEPPASQWRHLDSRPYRLLRKKWQGRLLTMLWQTVQTDAMARRIDVC